jgi:hypothetical protein
MENYQVQLAAFLVRFLPDWNLIFEILFLANYADNCRSVM